MDLPRFYNTTPAERSMAFPCDRYADASAEAFYRAVDIDAPPATVFRWLCQLRVAPYSYDLIDNFPHCSPRRLTPGLENLRLGQRFAKIFELVEFEPDVQITIATGGVARLFGRVHVTYLVTRRGRADSRLVVKLLICHPGGWLESRMRSVLLGWGDLVMMRKQLLTLKSLAEETRLSTRAGFAAA